MKEVRKDVAALSRKWEKRLKRVREKQQRRLSKRETQSY